MRDLHQELALSLRQMSAMLTAGIPIVETLSFLGRSSGPGLSEVYRELSIQVARGNYLSSCMKSQAVFPSYMVGLVAVGEQSGSLVAVLGHLADYLERTLTFRRRMVAALSYPAVLLTVSLGLLWLLSYSLLPAMLPFFQQLGVELPALTRFVLWLTRVVASPLTLLVLILMVVTVLLVRRQLLEAEEDSDLRRRYDLALLRLPVVGSLLEQGICARMLRMLSLTGLLGLDLSRTLRLLEGVAGNRVVVEKLLLVREDVYEGCALSQALANRRLFNRAVQAMVRVGEETGRLPRMSELMAGLYDQDIELSLTRISALAEPLILGFTSLLVGTLCVATMLPWINLMQGLV